VLPINKQKVLTLPIPFPNPSSVLFEDGLVVFCSSVCSQWGAVMLHRTVVHGVHGMYMDTRKLKRRVFTGRYGCTQQNKRKKC